MINITRRGWAHIVQHHTDAQFSRQRKKSKFYDKGVFDAGHPVGTERNSGKPTSLD